jgi:dolichol-phosphate mannosyltransferase
LHLGRNVTVVIPTYNERENIEALLGKLIHRLPEVSIVVVDDSSPDGTGSVVSRLALTFPNISLITRENKNGIGPAYLQGFAQALSHLPEFVVQMDADGSHSVEDLTALLSSAKKGLLVVGSRWIQGGAVIDWPRKRIALSKIGNLLARWALPTKVRDATGGFRIHDGQMLELALAKGIVSDGYAFQLEVLRNHLLVGTEVVEVPITFHNRTHGTSKMSLGIAFEAVIFLLKVLRKRTFKKELQI